MKHILNSALYRFTTLPFHRFTLCVFLAVFSFASTLNAQPSDYEFVCGSSGTSTGPTSGGPENPICTDPNSVRYVRVAIHYLLREETLVETVEEKCVSPHYFFNYVGPGNFTETQDGLGNPAYNGFQHAENVIGLANEMMATNQDQRRKEPGINYPAHPPAVNIQYLLVGYFSIAIIKRLLTLLVLFKSMQNTT